MKIRLGLSAAVAAGIVVGLVGCFSEAKDPAPEAAEADLTTPQRIVTRVTAGIDHTCALKSNGTVECLGYFEGSRPPPDAKFTELAGGSRHVCALTSLPTLPDGVEAAPLTCFGSSSNGQTRPPTRPPVVDGGSPTPIRFSHVASGTLHTCGVIAESESMPGPPDAGPTVYAPGAVLCWGGTGANDPATKSPPGVKFGQIAAGQDHTCGIKTDDTLECWGAPTPATPAAGVSYILANKPTGTFKQIVMSHEHACALATDGTAVCWGGKNFSGENNVPEGLKFKQLAIGRDFSCGIVDGGDANGKPKCWGYPNEGALAAPDKVLGQIAAGRSHVCGLTPDNATMHCWGDNRYNEAPATHSLYVAGTPVIAADDAGANEPAPTEPAPAPAE